MRRRDDIYAGSVEGTNQLDPADSLAGEIGADPLDAGYSPPDREPAATRWGSTEYEVIHGESLDQRLAEDEPDISEDLLDEFDSEPRAGRLVAIDEDSPGAARDVGRAGWAATAEEAAMHVIYDDALDADLADEPT
jgi:hypothetical protein